MVWPAKALRQFLVNTSLEFHLNPAYVTILNTIFSSGPYSAFTVVQEYMPPLPPSSSGSVSRERIDFVATHYFWHGIRDEPVMFLELKRAQDLSVKAQRHLANKQMRECYVALQRAYDITYYYNIILTGNLKAICPLPTLHGISAFGRNLCFYQTGAPGTVIADPRLETEDIPQECWGVDILTEEGEKRLKGIAENVKAMCKRAAWPKL
jgi:hypothetical protein